MEISCRWQLPNGDIAYTQRVQKTGVNDDCFDEEKHTESLNRHGSEDGLEDPVDEETEKSC